MTRVSSPSIPARMGICPRRPSYIEGGDPAERPRASGLRAGCGVCIAVLGEGGFDMRYIAAWMLGVPVSVIALWYVLGHSGCGM
jgi:hypothetical protein